MKRKKFKAGTVSVQFTKDVPYFTSHDTDKANKLTGDPLKDKAGKPIIQFEKDSREKLMHDFAGKLVASGYAKLLDEKNSFVDTKELVTK